MGQGQSITEYSAENLRQFNVNYELLREFNDARLGDIRVYRNRTYRNVVFGTTRSFSTESDFQAYIKELVYRCDFRHKNISSIIGYQRSRNENVCGSNYVLQYFGEYHQHDLQQELDRRVPGKEFFTEAEVWYILEAVMSACYYFEQRKIYHGDLRPLEILLTEEGFAKIVDHGIVHPSRTGYVKTITGLDKVYLSPELMLAYSKRDMYPTYNVYKSDIYSLGMTLLYLISFVNPITYCYDYLNATINHDRVEELLRQGLTRYSQFLIDVIRRMLLVREEYRMTFSELYALISPYQTQIRTMQSFNPQV